MRVAMSFVTIFATLATLPLSAKPLQLVGPWEIHSLDPASNGVMFTRLQVAETLVDADTKGQVRPGLASKWSVSPDGLSWTFQLRPNAFFHDGTAVAAAAVAAALEKARKKPGVIEQAPIQTIRASDANTVVIELSKPFTPLAAMLAHPSLIILAPAAYGADGGVTAVIGSGPYKIQQLAQPQRVSVSYFVKWGGKVPVIKEAEYLSVGRGESRALMAESGQADLVFGLDPVSLQRLKNNPALQISSVTLPRSIQLKLNASHPAMLSPKLRLALSQSLNRAAMATALLRDPEMAATQLFPPSMTAWHQKGLPALTYQPAMAMATFKASGWVKGSDGYLSRQGKPFKLTLRTYPDRPELPTLATAIQDQLKQVGIQVEVKVGNSSEIPAAHKEGSLELALYARNYAMAPDPIVTLMTDFAGDGGEWGAMRWHSETFDKALQQLTSGKLDAVANAKARLQVSSIIQSELPMIPVAWYRQSAVVNHRLAGVVLDPLERNYGLTGMSWRK
ncbi:ABC transporter substrate-binding protein [Leeia sp. TBRC 13508]|uniref:ABC transporter substrate-binding protein n=1 Tax=Leeia speluncae TaxID=2884804 RepID=A0ABS8D3E6_9NEIS|nr:ABC transporter substrate-binding protein [Leeia speluncae]MCB6182723.1 ABC transporter substrate-binding protein [Leeia speluncae]